MEPEEEGNEQEQLQGEPAADLEMREGDEGSGDEGESSDSEEEVEVDPADMELLMKLEADLEANPNLYDTHIQYLELLRRCRLHERLRTAHERMASYFPLSEALWMDWVNDELARAGSPEDVQRIQNLFEKATRDYLSVSLWCSYLEFVQEFDPEVQQRSQEGLKKFRALCEAALTAAGLHVTEGGRIWDVYRGFELALEAEGAGGDKHEELVRHMFHRQLQVPLADGPATLEAYTAWEAKHGGAALPPHVAKGYARAQEAVQLRKPYEDAVSPDRAADAHLLAAYMAYLKLEQAQGDPARMQCMYERAVAVFPVTHELWVQYGRYLELNLKIPSVIASVYDRALRNCYWVGSLWTRAIRAAARAGAVAAAGGGAAGAAAMKEALEQQEALYEKALKAGLQDYESYLDVVLARLDGLRYAASLDPEARPALRAAFQQASQIMGAYFPDMLDRSLRLPAYWAHCEVHVMDDVPAARAVWEDVLKSGLGRFYEPWAAYAAMERALRNVREARGVYKRAYSRRLEEGGQLAICAEWLKFEREEGSPEDYLAASLKVDPIMEEAAAAAAAAADTGAVAVAKAAAKQAPKLTKEDAARMRREHDANYGKKKEREREQKPGKKEAAKAKKAEAKRPREQQPEEDAQPAAAAAPAEAPVGKKAKLGCDGAAAAASAPAPAAAGTSGAMDTDGDGGGGDGRAAEGAAAAASASASAAAAAAAAAAHVRYTDDQTVFVKGLRMNLRDGELDEVFKPCGGLKEVRLMRDADGRFRGFAYVEFETAECLAKAVALNGSLFQNKPLIVAKSAPPGSGGGRGGAGGGGGGRGFGGGGFEQGRGRGRGRGGFDDGGGGYGRGRGGFERGRGRGRSGGGFEGGGRGGRGGGGDDGWQGGGRGGGGGEGGDGGGGGHARRGLGFTAGRGGRGGRGGGEEAAAGAGAGPSGGHGAHHRQHVQIDEPAPSRPGSMGPPTFVPRAVAVHHAGGDDSKAKPQGEAPKSNDEFRKMLLAKK